MAALLSGHFIPMALNTILFIVCVYEKDAVDDAALPNTFPRTYGEGMVCSHSYTCHAV